MEKDFQNESYNKFPNHIVYGLNDSGLLKHTSNRRRITNQIYKFREDLEKRWKIYKQQAIELRNKRKSMNNFNSFNNDIPSKNKNIFLSEQNIQNNKDLTTISNTENKLTTIKDSNNDNKKIQRIKILAKKLSKNDNKIMNSKSNQNIITKEDKKTKETVKNENENEKQKGNYLVPDSYFQKPKDLYENNTKNLLKTLYCRSPSHDKNVKTINLANMILEENKNIRKTLFNSFKFKDLSKDKWNLPKINIGVRKIISETKGCKGQFGIPINHKSYFMGERYNPGNYDVQPKNWTQRNVYGYLFAN